MPLLLRVLPHKRRHRTGRTCVPQNRKSTGWPGERQKSGSGYLCSQKDEGGPTVHQEMTTIQRPPGNNGNHGEPESRGNNSKRPLFLMSHYFEPCIICSLIFKKWPRFCRARICRFIFSPARNIPPSGSGGASVLPPPPRRF